ncbi:uncharacterized protein METZ01_LOCUS78364 [marine metagenome]|uniref:Uncharacterized protein n=1 Tax=marine metagenome TaxID=408172 RepID=A0A381UBE2_9ZZZZ
MLRTFRAHETVIIFCMLFLIGHSQQAQVMPSEEHIDSVMAAKVASIKEYGLRETESSSEMSTRFSEEEIARFLSDSNHMPNSVRDIEIALARDNRFIASSVIDLDRIEVPRSDDLLNPMNYLQGQLPMVMEAKVYSETGRGRLEIERVELAGIELPDVLVREMIARYTRSANNPDGWDIDAFYVFPYRIEEVRVDSGEVIVVQ